MLQIDLDYIPRLQIALQQNGVQPLKLLRLTHTGEAPLDDLIVQIRLDPEVAPELVRPVARIDPGSTLNLADLRLALSTERLVGQTEREAGHLQVIVEQGEARLAEATFPIEVLAGNEWAGGAAPPELLAAFILPNHPAIATLLAAARDLLSQRTDRPDLDGYQSRDSARVLAVAGAIYDAVRALGITYVNPPASFERAGQKVRTPDQVHEARMGTCLDLTVVLAAALEQAGLRPLVVLIEGHAFPGVWLTEWAFPVPSLDDPVPVRKRADLGELVVFDSSASTQEVPFKEAVRLARGHLDDEARFLAVVDVWTTRRTGIRPLPVRGGATFQLLPEPAPASDAAPTELPELPSAPDRPSAEAPSTKLERWKSKLLDLSLNNRLLNHKDGKRVLPVLTAELAELEDALAAGARLTLAPRPDAPAQSPGMLWLDLPPAEAERRMVELYRTGRSHLLETGANATFLALGFLRWFESPSSQVPRLAPLILLPVTLDRGSVRGPYTVQLADDDAMINVSLLEKLTADFGLDTGGYDELPTDDQGLDVPRILQRFRALVRDLGRFEVVSASAITLYAFRKFLMWRDLEQRTEDLLANDVVRHLVEPGDAPLPVPAPFLDPERLDAERPAPDDLSVVDSDSSQLSAVFGAIDGNSFVLQGPPGTGKSQTITNLIAQAVARDKTVLFVAEKRAALDVVQGRLAEVGLGPFCLEAHSDKASKREIVRQLEAPLQLARARTSTDWEAHAGQLQSLRTELNRHVTALHTPGPFGETLFQAVSRLIGLRDAPRIPLGVQPPDRETFRAMGEALDVLAARTQEIGPPARSRWAGLGVRDWSPGWVRQVEEALDAAGAALGALQEAVADGAEVLALPEPADRSELAAWARMIDLLLDSPQPPAALLASPNQEVDGLLDPVVELGQRRQEAWEDLGQRFLPAVLEADRRADARQFASWAGSFFLLAFFMLFFARRRLRPLARGTLPDDRGVARDLEQAEAIRAMDAELAGQEAAARLLGHRFQGPQTDWEAVEQVRAWATSFRQALAAVQGSQPAQAARRREALIALATGDLLAPGSPARQRLQRATDAVTRWEEASRALSDLLAADPFGPDDLSALGPHLEACRAHTRQLQGHTAWLRAADGAEALGLGPLVEALRIGDPTPDQARPALDRGIRERWVEAVFGEADHLRHFRGVDHEQRIARFRELDAQARSLARDEIRARLAARLPDPHAPGEMAVLRRELKKKRAHKPVRALFAEIPHILPRLKPCVLMSPLSVARYLDPALDRFDLVVFDEASQIPPWDAIGAMARGQQVVVVGDSKQLPPTTFFQRGGDDEPDDDDLQDLESILDECVAGGLPNHALRWHYRSRHETLIAFSNHHYYDNKLHTFPTALAEVPELGVKWVHVPGVYDKGRSRTNRAEAEAVVAEIVRRLRDPELRRRSIGVVTFSMTQQRLIEDLLDEAMTDPTVEAGSGAAREPLFVKNLENVQGDERDVMLFSVGYGPDAQGRVSMNFGPLNRSGGERRLNVAITRARQLLVVYSTLRPEQIDLSRTRAVGVRHFKTFLDYAARGPRAIDEAVQLDPAADFDSPFEAQVCARLEAHGHTVHRQVGCAGYRIDLAVQDPDAPGTYLLGIECDGATYHSARSARDRDRTRAAVLRGLGWRLHRIWSTDWWHDPERELHRALAAIEEARSQPRPHIAVPAPPEAEAVEGEVRFAAGGGDASEAAGRPEDGGTEDQGTEEAAAEDRWTRWPEGAEVWDPQPILPGGPKERFDQDQGRIVAQITAAAKDAPLQLDAVIRDVASSWGFSRAGSRIRERIEQVARHAPETRVVDGVLWREDQDPNGWTGFRYCVGEASRDLQAVPVREVANAAGWVLQRAVALDADTLHREVAGVFGVSRVGKRVRERIAEGIALLVAEGRAEQVDDTIRVPPG